MHRALRNLLLVSLDSCLNTGDLGNKTGWLCDVLCTSALLSALAECTTPVICVIHLCAGCAVVQTCRTHPAPTLPVEPYHPAPPHATSPQPSTSSPTPPRHTTPHHTHAAPPHHASWYPLGHFSPRRQARRWQSHQSLSEASRVWHRCGGEYAILCW